ncbi:MAG: CheR family methyltransferase [Myxococcota bacterium]
MGASAGGLQALREFLSVLPSDAGLAVVVVQHLRATHDSALADLLRSHTDMRRVPVKTAVPVEPNTVYVIQAGTDLTYADGKLVPTPRTCGEGGLHLPVNHLFRSLAEGLGHGAAGIVLSGAGSDGVAGLRELRRAGALTLAQQPAEAEHPGMPQAAVDAGVVDMVLPVAQMPRAIERFRQLPVEAKAPVGATTADHPVPQDEGGELQSAVERAAILLRDHGDFDLKHYKPATVRRRFLRRMALAGFDEPESYLSHLRQSPAEQRALMRSLLIGVTDFFRNSAAFEALRREVVEPLVRSMREGDTIRVWIAGCSTGEEAYSLGMLLLDAMDAQSSPLRLQVFATDRDEDALAVARAGVYPASVTEQVPEHLLRKFMGPLKKHGYQVGQRLRDVMSFAVHDLCNDPPFSRMHLVSCRNVLIYLQPPTQQHVLDLLHFALHPGGYLFLGSSEAPGGATQGFEAVSHQARIFRKVGASRPLSLSRTTLAAKLRPAEEVLVGAPAGARSENDLSQVAKDALLDAKVPPSLVVSREEHVLYAHGDLGRFVQFPSGEPRLELAHVLRGGLITRVRAALYKVRRHGQPVTVAFDPAVGAESDGTPARVTVAPARHLGEHAMVITFEHHEPQASVAAIAEPSEAQETVVQQLERELEATREDLRNTSEELQSSNEELRASHEEAMTMNEELQSANEELEATTEELRSLNEELATANARLKEKVEELERAHDDLTNFFASARIPMLFLDMDLQVQRASPEARDLFGLDDRDVGKPVQRVAHELLQSGLAEEAFAVLKDLSPLDKELRASDGRWYARRILPYRTQTRRIDGVVVTFLDVTALKNAAERLRSRERAQGVIARLGLKALEEAPLQGFFDQTVREVQRTLATDFCKILELQPEKDELLLRAGVGWSEGLVGQATVGSDIDSQAGYTLSVHEPVIVEHMAQEKRFRGPPLLLDHGVVSGLSCVIEGNEGPYGVLGAHTRTHRAFVEEDAHFLQAVANVVASAVDRTLARRRLSMEREVARVVAESSPAEETLPKILRVLQEQLDLDVCELWLPAEPEGSHLQCVEALGPKAAHENAATLKELSGHRFAGGEGLVGSVWQQEEALWTFDLRRSSAFARSREATHLRLESGFAFPLVAGHERMGVIAGFARRRLIPDRLLLRKLESLGRAIGDLMHRRRTDEALRASESRYRAIFENVGVSLWEQDFSEVKRTLDSLVTSRVPDLREHLEAHPDIVQRCVDALRIRDVNRETLRLLGASSKEELVAGFEQVILPEEGRRAFIDQLVGLAEGRELLSSETRCRTLDGRILDVAYTVRFPAPSEGYERVLVSLIDISDRKAAVRALRDADRQKDDYLAMLGHELRNPLAAIRTAAELLHVAPSDDRDVESAKEVIDRQSWHMAKLLDGLLDVSRIVRGKISLDMEAVNLGSIVEGVLKDQETILQERGLSLRVRMAKGPLWMRGDPVRLTQAFANLLSNAAKFTGAPGTIEVVVERANENAVVRVQDTGAGIDPRLLPHVFEPFYQGPQPMDRKSGGLGLGLALVKGVVELHGGRVWAHSDGPGQGAEFGFRLPLSARVPSTVRPDDAPRSPRRVLVVEDNHDAAELLCRLLERKGHQVTVAYDGPSGLAMAQAIRPDVVLCDIGLPGDVNGYDVARAIRNGHQGRDAPLLVAMTGYGRPEDQRRAEEAGFDAHLTKPVDLAAIEDALAHLDAS